MKFSSVLFLLLCAACLETPKSPKNDQCFDPSGNNITCEAFTADLRASDLTVPVTHDDSGFTLGSFPMPARDENFQCGITPVPFKNYSYELADDHLVIDTDGIKVVFAKDDRRPDRLQGLWIAISTSDRRLKAQSIQFIGTTQAVIHSLCK
ncbi:MAG: hypothetical protein ACJ76H_03850 [Bacteriovoracaceae bacterium]